MAKEFTINSYFTSDVPVVLDKKIEQNINDYIEEYAVDIERREARAYERSLRIFLNC